MRIGHGYDVHRLVGDRPLIIGGVQIPYTKGLDGHSDADVLTHAVIDALLGAAALGDIGRMFPDSDGAYKDISSLVLLERVMEALCAEGLSVINLDATIIAQMPKLSPYLDNMRATISEKLRVDANCINIKATTEEHLGFTGSGEGIASHAVCLLKYSE